MGHVSSYDGDEGDEEEDHEYDGNGDEDHEDDIKNNSGDEEGVREENVDVAEALADDDNVADEKKEDANDGDEADHLIIEDVDGANPLIHEEDPIADNDDSRFIIEEVVDVGNGDNEDVIDDEDRGKEVDDGVEDKDSEDVSNDDRLIIDDHVKQADEVEDGGEEDEDRLIIDGKNADIEDNEDYLIFDDHKEGAEEVEDGCVEEYDAMNDPESEIGDDEWVEWKLAEYERQGSTKKDHYEDVNYDNDKAVEEDAMDDMDGDEDFMVTEDADSVPLFDDEDDEEYEEYVIEKDEKMGSGEFTEQKNDGDDIEMSTESVIGAVGLSEGTLISTTCHGSSNIMKFRRCRSWTKFGIFFTQGS